MSRNIMFESGSDYLAMSRIHIFYVKTNGGKRDLLFGYFKMFDEIINNCGLAVP